jgi:hypothetical protein
VTARRRRRDDDKARRYIMERSYHWQPIPAFGPSVFVIPQESFVSPCHSAGIFCIALSFRRNLLYCALSFRRNLLRRFVRPFGTKVSFGMTRRDTKVSFGMTRRGAKDSFGMTKRGAKDSFGMTKRGAKDSFGMTKRGAKVSFGMTKHGAKDSYGRTRREGQTEGQPITNADTNAMSYLYSPLPSNALLN